MNKKKKINRGIFLDDREQSAAVEARKARKIDVSCISLIYLVSISSSNLRKNRRETMKKKKKKIEREIKKQWYMTYPITRVVKCRKSEGTAASCNAGMNARA